MKKKKKYKKIGIFLCIIVLIFFVVCIINPCNLKADSGFDSSYDSSSSSSSSRDSSDGSLFDLIYLLIRLFVILWDVSPVLAIIVFGLIVFLIIKIFGKKSTVNAVYLDKTKDLKDEDIIKIIPCFNRKEFIKDRYNDFVKIQNNWMNFDYDTLRKMLTDELYNQYEMQLDTLKVKNEKNVMDGFELKDAMITNIVKNDDKVTVTTEFVIEFYDYITLNEKVVRGNKNNKMTVHYEMIFVCNINKSNDKKCPNCGAPLDDSASNVCTYCGSVITSLSDKWVLSKKVSK